jgi:hypothetical protein
MNANVTLSQANVGAIETLLQTGAVKPTNAGRRRDGGITVTAVTLVTRLAGERRALVGVLFPFAGIPNAPVERPHDVKTLGRSFYSGQAKEKTARRRSLSHDDALKRQSAMRCSSADKRGSRDPGLRTRLSGRP